MCGMKLLIHSQTSTVGICEYGLLLHSNMIHLRMNILSYVRYAENIMTLATV